jgi:hypothetical protein
LRNSAQPSSLARRSHPDPGPRALSGQPHAPQTTPAEPLPAKELEHETHGHTNAQLFGQLPGRGFSYNRRNYNGTHKTHDLLLLALTDERGNLIWISAARKGSASEITSARQDKIAGHLRSAGLGALADLGFVGLDDDPTDPVIVTGYKATGTRRLTAAQVQANQLLAATPPTRPRCGGLCSC